MLVFILLLGSGLTTALVAMDYYTAPIIKRNQEIKKNRTILKVFGIESTEEEIERIFPENITVKEGRNGEELYLSKDGRQAFIFKGSGFQGTITGVIAMAQDLKTIQNIEIIKQVETPGLGSRIAERNFLDQFNGKIFEPELTLVPEGQGAASDKIDGITGATMSCKALIGILNQQYGEFSASVAGQ